MFILKRSMYTETSHLLKNHPGLCKNLHGHSYKWTVVVRANELRNDMVMDFGQLKEIMNEAIGPYDHAVVMDNASWMSYKLIASASDRVIVFSHRPTAERMAREVYSTIAPKLPPGVKLESVVCRETRNNEAVYHEG